MKPSDDPDGFWLRAVNEALSYDPDTGVLRWRVSPSKRAKIGNVAGYIDKHNRHRRIGIYGRGIFAHRIAWAIAYGQWPSEVIDHINRNPLDNRLSNLRDVPQIVNMRNQTLARDNSTGFSGISRNGNYWRVRLCGKYIGCSKDFNKAVEMRRSAEIAAGGFITTLTGME